MSQISLLQNNHLLETMKEHCKVARIGKYANPTKTCKCCGGEILEQEL